MEEVAASRRARSRFGDFAFSVLAAGLALGLLFATGRHLFGTQSVDRSSQSLTTSAATAVFAPAKPQPAASRAAAPLEASHGLPRASQRPSLSVGVRSALPPPKPATEVKRVAKAKVAAAKPLAKPVAMVKPVATAKLIVVAKPVAIVKPVAEAKPVAKAKLLAEAKPLGKAKPVAETKPLAKAIARSAPQVLASRARDVSPARVARLGASPAHAAFAPAANRLRPPSVAATPHRSGTRVADVPDRTRIERRSRQSALSIVEPPLGYDAQPALVLVPGAAQLELGQTVIPTIRSRRRR